MKITERLSIVLHTNEVVDITVDGITTAIGSTGVGYDELVDFYNRAKSVALTNRESWFVSGIDIPVAITSRMGIDADSTSISVSAPVVEVFDKEKINTGLNQLINFFTEFQFEPNFRFINTLAFHLNKSKKSATEFINNYFALMDSPFKNDVVEKMKSAEFKEILNNLSVAKPTSHINDRFKIYYGSAGTGKTTKAQKESDGRCVVCNATMLPSDIMEDFVFIEGKPSFKPSVFWECMKEGKPIVLDEINLLPFDSLRFLQGILDGKKSFDYKGHEVVINDGFKVIGTMNLTIGGMAYGLPEPLVDRCEDMVEFKLTAEMLTSALQ